MVCKLERTVIEELFLVLKSSKGYHLFLSPSLHGIHCTLLFCCLFFKKPDHTIPKIPFRQAILGLFCPLFSLIFALVLWEDGVGEVALENLKSA